MRKIKRKEIIKPYYQTRLGKLYHGDCMEVVPYIKEKIDLILTDPPYGKEYLYLYKNLSRLSKDKLTDNGICLTMAGQSYLTEVLNLMSENLIYHWTFSINMLDGKATTLWQRKVISFWKPILWYVKSSYKEIFVSDVLKSEGRDKRFHKWGQNINIMILCLQKFPFANLILDPFLGSGTTAIACEQLGRKWIGIEIEEESCKIAANRIEKEIRSKSNDYGIRKFAI